MPATPLDQFLASFSPPVRTLALRARERIRSHSPESRETVWPGWKMVGFGTGSRLAELVCGIQPLKTRINLVFPRGAELPDPNGLLEGTSRSGRHVKIDDVALLDSAAVDQLLEAAFALHRGGPESRAATRDLPAGDEAVKSKTGRSWLDWFALLDAAGAERLTHAGIVALLSNHAIDDWWRQTITVGYERARGLRQRNETREGYRVGAGKTVAVPVDRLYAAWADEALRERWLPGAAFTIRKATPSRSMRITWNDGTSVEVLFQAKGEAKSQVSIDQRRLPDAAAVEAQRSYWRERLERLAAVLGG